MYYLSKIAQAAGLTIILIGFIMSFPELMGYRPLLAGLIVFLFGWIVQKFMLRR